MFPAFPAPSHKNTILSSHGRPPWYQADGKSTHDAFVIGIAGGSASGKTFVADQIIRALDFLPTILILSQDSFYKEHTPEELQLAFSNEYDFDHPTALDMDLFGQCLKDLKQYKQTHIPIYSFVEHQRLPETKYLYGATVIIAEGIMALLDPKVRELYDLKIFVQCDSDIMLARRLRRDIKERGRSAEDVLKQYLRFVKPSYDNFVGPSAKFADIIIPGAQNTVAIDLVVNHIRRKVSERTAAFRAELSHVMPAYSPGGHPDVREWDRLVLLPQTLQLKGIHTILRDQTTSREDFVFFADRLATLIVEEGMNLLPFVPHSVVTPTGATAKGLRLAAEVCGVTILRAGAPLQYGLTRALPSVPLGALLIQSHPETREPLLLYIDLPRCLKEREHAENVWVFLLDTQIGTGATALMALRVLIDHGVLEHHIIFLTFIISQRGGPNVIRRAFPRVRIVTSAVDEMLKGMWAPVENGDPGGGEGRRERERELRVSVPEAQGRRQWFISPGMGNIGDRYFL